MSVTFATTNTLNAMDANRAAAQASADAWKEREPQTDYTRAQAARAQKRADQHAREMEAYAAKEGFEEFTSRNRGPDGNPYSWTSSKKKASGSGLRTEDTASTLRPVSTVWTTADNPNGPAIRTQPGSPNARFREATAAGFSAEDAKIYATAHDGNTYTYPDLDTFRASRAAMAGGDLVMTSQRTMPSSGSSEKTPKFIEATAEELGVVLPEGAQGYPAFPMDRKFQGYPRLNIIGGSDNSPEALRAQAKASAQRAVDEWYSGKAGFQAYYDAAKSSGYDFSNAPAEWKNTWLTPEAYNAYQTRDIDRSVQAPGNTQVGGLQTEVPPTTDGATVQGQRPGPKPPLSFDQFKQQRSFEWDIDPLTGKTTQQLYDDYLGSYRKSRESQAMVGSDYPMNPPSSGQGWGVDKAFEAGVRARLEQQAMVRPEDTATPKNPTTPTEPMYGNEPNPRIIDEYPVTRGWGETLYMWPDGTVASSPPPASMTGTVSAYNPEGISTTVDNTRPRTEAQLQSKLSELTALRSASGAPLQNSLNQVQSPSKTTSTGGSI